MNEPDPIKAANRDSLDACAALWKEIDTLKAERNALLEKVKELEAARDGFDRVGPDIGVDWKDMNSFPCTCRWSSAHHGHYCPEHGKVGVVVPKGKETGDKE